MQYANAVPQAGISDEAACRTKCDADTGCIGFEIDTNPTPHTCSFTTSVTDNASASAGVVHYKRAQACPFKTTSERKSADLFSLENSYGLLFNILVFIHCCYLSLSMWQACSEINRNPLSTHFQGTFEYNKNGINKI